MSHGNALGTIRVSTTDALRIDLGAPSEPLLHRVWRAYQGSGCSVDHPWYRHEQATLSSLLLGCFGEPSPAEEGLSTQWERPVRIEVVEIEPGFDAPQRRWTVTAVVPLSAIRIGDRRATRHDAESLAEALAAVLRQSAERAHVRVDAEVDVEQVA